jgi:ribose transport system ATP-binding protein
LPETAVTPFLEFQDLTKTFGDRRVLDRVDIAIRHGEIHGLVGMNGSGKSTIIKILAGYHAPDSQSRLRINGQVVRMPLKPTDPVRLGMSFVHQELCFLQQGTVLENFKIGTYRTRAVWRISWKFERRDVEKSLRHFGLGIKPDTVIASLDPVEQALVAIARALDHVDRYGDTGSNSASGASTPRGALLILDEPTAYLPADEAARLFDAMREVVSRGYSILFVSHRLPEILAVTDRVTVLRDGRRVGTFATAALDEERLVEHIVGVNLDTLYPRPRKLETRSALLTVRGLCGEQIQNLSFEIRPGEIVGVTGLRGDGYERIPYFLFGARRATAGELTMGGATHSLTEMNPRRAIGLGIAFLPGDRLKEGGAPTGTLLENITLASLRRLFMGGLLLKRRELSVANEVITQFQVSPAKPDLPLVAFSGGNQQKALIARWVLTAPKCFLLYEPTQGVDVGAKRKIFRVIRDLAQRGVGILLSSAEYDDLAHLCDRVIIVRNGTAVGELYGADLVRDRILEQCFKKPRDRP